MTTRIKSTMQPFMTDEMFAAIVKIFGPPRCFFAVILIRIVYMWSYLFGQIKYLSKEDYRIWRDAMLAMIREYYQTVCNIRVWSVVLTFAMARIEVIRKTPDPDRTNPIVILCVKNDLRKIRILVDHYRTLGIKRFAFMDNGSDDGTYEWMLEQSDIDLYRCTKKYRTYVKEGWINRIASYYGFDRWVILTDSDELVVYEGMEDHSLAEVVEYGRKNGIRRFKALMLDTYSKGKMFDKADDIRKEYCWIDTDSYSEQKTWAGKTEISIFIGGPRFRLMQIQPKMSKLSLIYFEKGTVSDNAHFQYPHEEIVNAPCHLGILHYKFIDSDYSDYEKRAMKGSGFYRGGRDYRLYMGFFRSRDNSSFMYEGSTEFKDSSALKKIDFIKPIPFD